MSSSTRASMTASAGSSTPSTLTRTACLRFSVYDLTSVRSLVFTIRSRSASVETTTAPRRTSMRRTSLQVYASVVFPRRIARPAGARASSAVLAGTPTRAGTRTAEPCSRIERARSSVTAAPLTATLPMTVIPPQNAWRASVLRARLKCDLMKRVKTHATPKAGRTAARVAIVRARWNEEVTLALERGAILRATDAGATVALFEVPGSFELPAAVALLADTGRYDAIVPLGCLVRGETP